MLRSILLVWAMGCGPASEPPLAPILTGREEALGVASAVRVFRQKPSPEQRSAVSHACARAAAVAHPIPDLDLVLGDALANVLLRPQDGIARFEPHLATLDPAATDAWLDALARAGDLERLAREHERLRGSPLDVSHPAAFWIASRAAFDPALHWQDVRDGVVASRDLESTNAPMLPMDARFDSTGAALEALGVLLDGWEMFALTAREPLPAETAFGESRGVLTRGLWVTGWSHVRQDLRPLGTAVDLARFPGRTELIVFAETNDARVALEVEGSWEAGAFHVIRTNDPARFRAWSCATDLLEADRRAGQSDSVATEDVQRSCGGAFVAGGPG